MKRPAFQFYPADWAKDLGLRSCSLAARGLWMELLCMAHESECYGVLMLNGAPLTDTQIINTVAGSTRKMLAELESAAVFSRDESGAIFSRRMVRDEKLRETRSSCGKLGGNPNLVASKVKQNTADGSNLLNYTSNQKPTPSSSSASSSKSDVGVNPSDNAHATIGKNGADRDKNTSKTKHGTHWSGTQAGITATAETLGITRHPHEDESAFKDRVFATVNAKLAQDAAKASRGPH